MFSDLMPSIPSQVEPLAGPSRREASGEDAGEGYESFGSDDHTEEDEHVDGLGQGMDPEGFSGPSQKIVKPLTPEALVAFKAAQDKAGIVYISRIPPGMRPAKVRHLMSAYGEVGRVYLQQEDAKRAYLRKKFTATKKPHFTEGWVEFKDKKIARSVADMLNAQPIGGKKGSRWRDDVWTMKYLPKFKWNMLTEQVAHEAQIHQAKLRVELSQSRAEQQEYLRNVELAKVLEKRAGKKKEKGEEFKLKERPRKRPAESDNDSGPRKKRPAEDGGQLDAILGSIF
ncbi:Pre-rRNA-processing protein ESF2 [Leucoagaricus sp. SymC.cos]|nr:Pre-rRNA-processing protein ESF2 [Leucoagaricus sp. SymC.cos]